MDITNFSSSDIARGATNLIAGTNVAAALGITSNQNNLQQFYNRFGQKSVWKADTLSYKINTSMFFEVEFSFKPAETSHIPLLLKEALLQASNEDLKYFIQSVEVPAFTVESTELMETEMGLVNNPIAILKPSANTINLSILNTEYPLHEHVFYPWMRETVSHHWVYDERPYTVATMKIKILDSKSSEHLYSYILTGVRPTEIPGPSLSQNAVDQFTRDVTFAFNNMYFVTNNKIEGSVLNQLFDSFVGRQVKDKLSVAKGDVNAAFGKLGSLTTRK